MVKLKEILKKRNQAIDAKKDSKKNFKQYFVNKKDFIGLELYMSVMHSIGLFGKIIYNFEMELPNHSQQMFHAIKKYTKVIIKAARGHLKSTTLQIFAVWVCLFAENYLKENNIKDKKLRILQLSYSSEQAEEWHKEFQGYLVDAIQYLNLPINTKKITKNSTKTNFGIFEIKSRGITGALRGKHPHIILADDLLTDKNFIKPSMMQTIFYQGVIGMTMPVTKVVVVGTPLRYNDLLAELSELHKDEDKIVYTNEGYPISVKGYVYLKYAAIKSDGSELWNERPLSWLKDKENEMGSTRFAREFLCIPMSFNSAYFNMDMLSRCDRTEYSFHEVSGGRLFVGCDMANSLEEGSSFSAFTLLEEVGGKKSGELVYRDLWVKRSNSNKEKLKVLYRWQVLYGTITLVNVEKNAYQGSFVDLVEDDDYRKIVSQEFWREGILDEGMYCKQLNVIGMATGGEKQSENIGIPGLLGMFETQKLMFPAKTPYDVQLAQTIKDDFAMWIINPDTEKFESLGTNDDISMSTFINIKGYRSMKKKSGFAVAAIEDF